MGNFDFVTAQWPALGQACRHAELHLRGDPRASAAFSRRAAELITEWIYTTEQLPRPADGSFSNLTRQRAFVDVVGQSVGGSLRILRLTGNDAVHHDGELTLPQARIALEQLHSVLRWLDYRYGDPDIAPPGIFEFAKVPPAPATVVRLAREELARTQAEFEQARADLAVERDRNAALQAELAELRAQAKANEAANVERHRAHDIPDPLLATEAETRRDLIDLLLREAGWTLRDDRDREFALDGLPTPSGTGKVDYVLWGDDGLPLAVVEAKRTSKNAEEGRLQARHYADALEQRYGQRPLIYYANGFDTWLWDDRRYPPRAVAGFATKDQLLLAVQRRTTRVALDTIETDRSIVERPYQLRAVRAVAETFESGRRRALLVMATGTGKTRTVIALVDVLQRANWVKRVLFLADRKALVSQAVGAFKTHLPDSSPVDLSTDRETDGRVFVSTYQSVMGLIDEGDDDLRRFGPNYFDLIVVDEAHRSIYARYGEIFEYFDALVIGLTATPRADVDHNTYRLFQLQEGVPTDAFELDEAIEGGYLVPPRARVIDLGFMRRGIRYADLSPAEREQWDSLEWTDGDIPDEIDAAAMNRWLFNTDTVDKVLAVLMEEGHRVAGGTRLGKTIVFAKNYDHAKFIEERLDFHYPELRGAFASLITYRSGPYVQTEIDAFAMPAKAPHLAVSVDMLDTGVDVPDVVNLVFFKPVHSQTKYWQMIGRGTRLRPDLYAPGQHKTDFIVFDVCGNVEYFNLDAPEPSVSRSPSVPERIFTSRVRLLTLLGASVDPDAALLRSGLAERLHGIVAGMNRDNFLVRKRLRAVERFSVPAAWTALAAADADDAASLADLPSAMSTDTDEDALRFDALMLDAQVARAAEEQVPAALRERLIALARALGERRSIPAVGEQAWLLDALVDPAWWDDVSVVMLEDVRLRLRALVRLIDPAGRAPVYTDFVDTLDPARQIDIARVAPGLARAAFREKLFAFLDAHEDNVALRKLRTGRQLTDVDLDELETILVDAGGLTRDDLDRYSAEAGGLGRLIRSISGLERSAIEELLADFVADPAFTQRQHAFIELVVQQLTLGGVVDAGRLYEDPFDGPEGVFEEAEIVDLIERLRRIDAAAEPPEGATA